MTKENTLFHPDTLKILTWIADLIKKEMTEQPANSKQLAMASKALDFIQGIKPSAYELSDALQPTNHPDMHQTKMFDT